MNMRNITKFSGVILFLFALQALPVKSNENAESSKSKKDKKSVNSQEMKREKMDLQTAKKTKKRMEQGEFVSIFGKIVEINKSKIEFVSKGRTLDIFFDKKKRVKLEEKIRVGDSLIISATLDENFLKDKRLNPDIIYLSSKRKIIYKDDYLEESFKKYFPSKYKGFKDLPSSSFINAIGKIEEVNKNKIILNTGTRKLSIDISVIKKHKGDKHDSSDLKNGDLVRVAAKLDKNYYSQKRIKAFELSKLILKKSDEKKDK